MIIMTRYTEQKMKKMLAICKEISENDLSQLILVGTTIADSYFRTNFTQKTKN